VVESSTDLTKLYESIKSRYLRNLVHWLQVISIKLWLYQTIYEVMP
jgi:hypothetical protein